MTDITAIFADPAAWAALAALIAMEVVLGIDNLIFISILTNKLPESHRARARKIGIGLALGLRLFLLSFVAFIVSLTRPIFEAFGYAFSWRDLILIAGGLFLVWKATKEIHHNVDVQPNDDIFDTSKPSLGFGAAIFQIILLDLVFSIDSIITAVGMTEHVPIMFVAVIVAGGAVIVPAGAASRLRERHPTGGLRPSCAQGLYLRRDGLFGGGGRAQHRRAGTTQAQGRLSGAAKRRVRRQPGARLALRFGDLACGHFPGNLGAHALAAFVAAEGGKVEPFVRFDQIDGEAGTAAAIGYAKFEIGFGVTVPRIGDAAFDEKQSRFEALSHTFCPFVPRVDEANIGGWFKKMVNAVVRSHPCLD